MTPAEQKKADDWWKTFPNQPPGSGPPVDYQDMSPFCPIRIPMDAPA